MKFRKTGNFFYFYFQSKIEKIKQQVLKEDLAEGREDKKNISWFFRQALHAAIVNVLLYELFFYLNLGRLLSLSQLSGDSYLQFEVLTGFFYIFSIFLVFPFISTFLNEKMGLKDQLLKWSLELLCVVIVNAILLSLLNLAPLFLLIPDLEPEPGRLRTAYLVTGIFSLFFYFFVEREKSKKRLQEDMLRSARLQKDNLQAQLEGLKNQVNPHFLFNSLNVLGSLIHQDRSRAIEFTHRLGNIYRSFMENGKNHLISFKKELEVARAYIYLLETRFGAAVQFEIQISPSLLELKIPTGSLQMLIENTIKHNGSTKKKPLKVLITSEDDFLVIKNNLQPRKEKLESTHTGLNNIKSRYRYLSEETVIFKKTETEFIAKLPLLKNDVHEDPDN